MKQKFNQIVSFIQDLYRACEVPLHTPIFAGNEKKYLVDCIDSTFVSSVGPYVNKFEQMLTEITGAPYAVATNCGTSALHIALKVLNVRSDDEVLCPDLTFVATANAILYCHAHPVFIDSDTQNLGISPEKLEDFLSQNSEVRNDGYCYNKKTNRRISACIVMHVFGHPVLLSEILKVCDQFHVPVIEDAAESLGSYYKGKHTGTQAKIGTLSLNGNKIVTSGGGGALITSDSELAKRAKHLTTTGKIPHAWEYFHDEVAYNYRLPNINAALACAQLEQLDKFLQSKRQTASIYADFFAELEIDFLKESAQTRSNYWLNAITLPAGQRDDFLAFSNQRGVMTRPIWTLMHKLPMFQHCQKVSMENAEKYESTVVNIPSSYRC